MSVVVSYKRQSVVFVVMAIIALAATEVAVRHFDDPALDAYVCTSFMDHVLYRDIPLHIKHNMCREYVGVKYDPDAKTRVPLPITGTHVNINADGFRGPPLNIFGDNSYRIFVLGGSTTYGLTTVSDDQTIPALLEKKLRNSGLDVQVINAGVPGASTIEETYRLEYDIIDHEPDMVIMYDGINEWITMGISYEEFLLDEWMVVGGMYFPANGEGGMASKDGQHERSVCAPSQSGSDQAEDADNSTNTVTTPKRAKWGPGLGIERLMIALDYKTALGMIQALKDMTMPAALPTTPESWADCGPAIEQRLRSTWGRSCELGDQEGFVTVNFLQPHIGTGNRILSDHEVELLSDYFSLSPDFKLYANASKFLTSVDLTHSRYPPCTNVHDLRGVFDGMDGETIYFDWSHMNGKGNDVVASAMHDIVLPLVISDMNE